MHISARRGQRVRQPRTAAAAVALIAVFSVGMEHTYAYIDPGTGSLVYQTVLAMILGAGLLFRQTWFRIARAIASRFGKRPHDKSQDTPSDSHS